MQKKQHTHIIIKKKERQTGKKAEEIKKKTYTFSGLEAKCNIQHKK